MNRFNFPNVHMRIAIWHNLPSGGGKRALYDHVRGLVGRGHYLEAWCPASADTAFLPLSEYCVEHVLPWNDTRPSVRLLAKSRAAGLTILNRLAEMDRHCREAAGAINAGDFEVVFANSCQFFGATPIGRYVRGPSVLYLQEPRRPLYEACPTPPFLGIDPPGRSVFAPWYVRKRLRDFFTTDAMRTQIRAEYESVAAHDRVLVNSYFSRESVLKAYGLNADVCYLGVSADTFRPSDGPHGDYVVGVGAFVSGKNIEFVIRAIGHISTPRPKLVWIGNSANPEYVRGLTTLASELGVQLDARQAVPDAEVVRLLAGARVMAYAPRLEPFGYAPLEANACGIPVVAVAEGGVRETVRDGENGLLVDANPAAMAAGIERLRGNPELAGRLGEQGRRTVATRWHLEAATDRLDAFLRATGARVGRE